MIYAFEEIGTALAQPPLAARRALLCSGVSMPPSAWAQLAVSSRLALVAEGVLADVSVPRVQALVAPALRSLRMLNPVADPPVDAVPQKLHEALAALRPITAEEWTRLRPLDRFALAALCGNARLLWLALGEMGQAGVLTGHAPQTWAGALAHCELRALPNVLFELSAGRVLDGKAIVVARASGLRAARNVSSVIDAYAEYATGPIELDARVDADRGVVVWQAHVSTSDGAFFGAAALLAASTAAVALHDALSPLDATASIVDAGLREEAWTVGTAAFREEATAVNSDIREIEAIAAELRARRAGGVAKLNEIPPHLPASPQEAPVSSRPAAGAPTWMLVAMLVITALSLAAAVASLLLKHR